MQEYPLMPLDNYYQKQDADIRECLLALKSIILALDKDITTIRKFQIPYFKYKEFGLGFLWVVRKKIILGFVEDKKILAPSLCKIKNNNCLLPIDPMADIPLQEITDQFTDLINKYKMHELNK